MRLQLLRPADVALAEGGVLQQLPEPIAVAFRRVHRLMALHDEQAVVRGVEFHGVDHPTWDQQVVAVFEVQRPNEGAQPTASLMDEDHLIAVGVLVEVSRLSGPWARRGRWSNRCW